MMKETDLEFNDIDFIIQVALEEDIKSGDITTNATISPEKQAEAVLLVKEEGIIAGLTVAERVFHQIDPELEFLPLLVDGSPVSIGDEAATIKGRAKSVLLAERTALNFLQRMSGIATAAHRYSEKIKHTKARVLDTRKTTPCLRVLEKKAVEMGGGTNHRYGLYDMFLIKDNHIAVAGSITAAIEACKAYRKKNNAAFAIEIEVTNFDELDEALRAKPDRIMLDNFSIDDMSKAVGIVNGACETEASGGITIDTIAQVAETGVDFISSGALTHSVKALDISLEVEVK